MPDSSAPWATNNTGPVTEPTPAEKALPKVPPPPSDIALRTMASDLRSMHETGGSHPKPIQISVAEPSEANSPAAQATRSRKLTYIVATVVVLVLLAVTIAFILLRK